MDRRTTLEQLNTADAATFVRLLDGLYEQTAWVTQRVSAMRPFASAPALLQALWQCVATADAAEQLTLIRAHPDLGENTLSSLTVSSAYEQRLAGLDADGTPANNAEKEGLRVALRDGNAAYRDRFGFPFIVAVRGSDGTGMPLDAILASQTRRLRHDFAEEQAEALRQINRIAELRLNRLLGIDAMHGNQVLIWCEALAAHSEDETALTCTYLTPAHRASAEAILEWMRGAGMQAHIDAFGNVVGRYVSDVSGARTLLTGSHYDTVRNGGKYDGRVGALLPVSLIAEMTRRGQRLPFHFDVVAFAEEEGVRFRTSFLGSSVLTGQLPDELLARTDEQGITLASALASYASHLRQPSPPGQSVPLPRVDEHWLGSVRAQARHPDELVAFLEMHIEQGPVLFTEQLPLGVVTAISGSKRYMVHLTGLAGHAGAMPMTLRRDAAAAAAEITLYVEERCSGVPTLVGTVGRLEVPNGSVNVVPGRCVMSIDIRAGDDATRDAAVGDVMQRIDDICARRGVRVATELVLESDTVPCAPDLQRRFADALVSLGLPEHHLPSGAGHDAVEMSRIADVGMLFIRCGNGGISHNPLETVTADDLDLAAKAFDHVVSGLARDEWHRLGMDGPAP